MINRMIIQIMHDIFTSAVQNNKLMEKQKVLESTSLNLGIEFSIF
jgi:cysteine synthase